MNASAKLQPRTIRIVVERGENLLFAKSPDLKGLIIAGKDFDELVELQVPRAIEAAYRHAGVDVVAMPLPREGEKGEMEAWYPYPRKDVERWLERGSSACEQPEEAL